MAKDGAREEEDGGGNDGCVSERERERKEKDCEEDDIENPSLSLKLCA